MQRIGVYALVSLLAVLAGAGRLYAAVTIAALHSFDGEDGGQPIAALADGGDGYLYGTTQYGGSGVTNPAGTVFRITSDGSFESLYTFNFQVTGDQPFASVLRLGGGSLFGTTRGSGSFNGSVFRLGSIGDFANLHTFTGYFAGADGGHPEAALVEGGDGNLYGTTTDGGAANVGTLYRIDAGGNYTLIHSFRGSLGPPDGASPRGALVLGGDGALYGTTSAAGPTQPSPAVGTVFRFTPGVSGVTTLHAFVGSNGAGPNTTLVKALDGYLYGTTSSGGAHNLGTVFRISEGGDFESLHSFDSSSGEGTTPGGLAAGSDGNLYGTTSFGGADYLGTLFRIRPNGSFQTLFSFSFLNAAGYTPRAPLVQADDGDFYGTTSQGGEGGEGTVFKIEGADILVPEPGTALASAAAGLALGFVAWVRRFQRSGDT